MSAPRQLLLLDQAPKKTHDYSAQLRAVVEAVGDNVWRGLAEIEKAMNYRYSQTSIAARVRELRRGYLPGWISEHKTENARHWYRVRRT
jgi:hypothetical protein